MMLQIKIFLRRWGKQKMYAFISIASLSIGLTCSVLLFTFIIHEYKIADKYSNNKNVYQVYCEHSMFENQLVKTSSIHPSKILKLEDTYPEIEDVCIIHYKTINIVNGDENEAVSTAFETFPNFAKLLSPKIMSGDLERTLSNPLEIAITRSYALKKFNEECPIGETLTFMELEESYKNDRYYYKPVYTDYSITTIIDDREKGIFNFEFLFLMEKENLRDLRGLKNYYGAYVKTSLQVDIVQFENKLNEIEDSEKVFFIPIGNSYFTKDESYSSFFSYRNKSLLNISFAIAIVILVIACFNYINISMTIHIKRLNTVGQQITFGAGKSIIFLQLLYETMFVVLVAVLISFLLIYLCLPVFNDFIDSNLSFSFLFYYKSLFLIFFILTSVCFIPTLYIYYKVQKTSTVEILKIRGSLRSNLIVAMVILQFIITFVLLSYLAVIRQQMNFIVHSRPDSENIYILLTEGRGIEYLEKFKQNIESSVLIKDYTYSNILPHASISSTTGTAHFIDIDKNFLDFYKIKLLEGEFTVDDQKKEVLVNKTFIENNNIINPIDESVIIGGNHFIIKGVFEDFPTTHFSIVNQSVIIELSPPRSWNGMPYIKTDLKRRDLVKLLNEIGSKIDPDEEVPGIKSMKEVYVEMHQAEFNTLQIVNTFSIISLLLSLMGLFGISWYSVECRNKEIALRKINGAHTHEVATTLIGRFVKWISISGIIGFPVAWYICSHWLEQFVYRVESIHLCLSVYY